MFATSERLCRFLTWTVEQTLKGEGKKIKGYVIAREVFDRGEDFDPRIDSIVRTEAQRLRRKLSEYYHTQGATDDILIAFAPGSYEPAFQYRAARRPKLVAIPGGRHGVAVLRFMNLTGEAKYEAFCHAIAATIQERLVAAKIRLFTALTFGQDRPVGDLAQEARALGVEKIQTGGVQLTQSKIRVHVRVIDAESGHYMFVRSFDRELKRKDVLMIQDEIAELIIKELTRT